MESRHRVYLGHVAPQTHPETNALYASAATDRIIDAKPARLFARSILILFRSGGDHAWELHFAWDGDCGRGSVASCRWDLSPIVEGAGQFGRRRVRLLLDRRRNGRAHQHLSPRDSGRRQSQPTQQARAP
jgi:hypothetical protein